MQDKDMQREYKPATPGRPSATSGRLSWINLITKPLDYGKRRRKGGITGRGGSGCKDMGRRLRCTHAVSRAYPHTLGSQWHFLINPPLAGFHLLRTAETNSPGTWSVGHFRGSMAMETKEAHMESAPPREHNAPIPVFASPFSLSPSTAERDSQPGGLRTPPRPSWTWDRQHG